MRYLSVCSGIEAATVAWHPLGWTPLAFAEIEAFPNAVLKHHYADVPNWGDVNGFRDWPGATVDVLVGGTPCQSFSVAGLREGLADPRGNLALVFLAIVHRYRPTWVVWENVPGVLSANGGRDFGSFLGGLADIGYGWVYRVLDAQYFGLAQRRQRVFVVASPGGWHRAAAVLLERASLSGHPAPRREARAGIAAGALSRALSRVGGGDDPGANKGAPFVIETDDIPEIVPQAMSAKWAKGTSGPSGDEVCNLIPVAFGGGNTSGPIDIATARLSHGGSHGRQDFDSDTFIAAPVVAFGVKDYGGDVGEDISPTLRAGTHDGSHANGGVMPAVAFADVADPVAANQARTYTREGTHNFRVSNVAHTDMQVRRLTPRECERLQGFPDDYTLVPYRNKPAADGPRYKALGNSMAVPVVRWIGRRIAQVEEMTNVPRS